MKKGQTKNKHLPFEILPRVAGAKFFVAGAIALSMIATSCNEDSPVGLDVQPKGDLLNAVVNDTASIITYTLAEDSLKTDDLPSGTALLGSYNDPIFGYTEGSLYTQFRLPTNSPSLSGTLDSIVLSLAYEGGSAVYGTTASAQTFKVYQVIQDISLQSAYYSNQSLNIYPSPVGSITFLPNITQQVNVGGVMEKAQLRIKLDQNFGNLLMTAGPNLSSNETFTQFFKGLHIAPENGAQAPGEGALLPFTLLDSDSKLTLYYHSSTDTAEYALEVNSSAARFSRFEHNYAGTPVQAQLANPSLGQDLAYIQSMAGVKTKVVFPHITHFTDSGRIAVNRAELVIKADPATVTTEYPAPERLFLVPVTSTGANGDLLRWPDFEQGTAYYGGTYIAAAKEYRFNITRYVQSIIDKKATDYGLYLLVSGAAVNPERVVIGGGSNAANSMKLRLTYTKLN